MGKLPGKRWKSKKQKLIKKFLILYTKKIDVLIEQTPTDSTGNFEFKINTST